MKKIILKIALVIIAALTINVVIKNLGFAKEWIRSDLSKYVSTDTCIPKEGKPVNQK